MASSVNPYKETVASPIITEKIKTAKNNNKLILGIVIGVILLCICSLLISAGVAYSTQRKNDSDTKGVVNEPTPTKETEPDPQVEISPTESTKDPDEEIDYKKIEEEGRKYIKKGTNDGASTQTGSLKWTLDSSSVIGTILGADHTGIINTTPTLADGKFVKITYTIDNNNSKVAYPVEPILVDSNGNEHEGHVDSIFYIEPDENLLLFSSIEAGTSMSFALIFDVPVDVQGLSLQVDDTDIVTGQGSNKAQIDLGL